MFNFFNTIWETLLKSIANLLPVVDPSSVPFLDSIQQIMATGYQLSFVIPWQTIFTSVAIIIGIEFFTYIIKMVMWALRLARG